MVLRRDDEGMFSLAPYEFKARPWRYEEFRDFPVRLTLDDSGVISAIDVGGARFLETVGVGSGVREEAFTSQFIGKTPPLTLNQDIDAVSGATLSSQAAVDAVNEAYAFLKAR